MSLQGRVMPDSGFAGGARAPGLDPGIDPRGSEIRHAAFRPPRVSATPRFGRSFALSPALPRLLPGTSPGAERALQKPGNQGRRFPDVAVNFAIFVGYH